MSPIQPLSAPAAGPATPLPLPQAGAASAADTDQARIEQLLWTEMLTHAGLADALTLNGGEGASSFARYVVEAVAADIAQHHPLGLSVRGGAA